MSRVERNEPQPHRQQSRQALRIPRPAAPDNQSSPGRTPNKAEGEVADIEEALDRQDE